MLRLLSMKHLTGKVDRLSYLVAVIGSANERMNRPWTPTGEQECLLTCHVLTRGHTPRFTRCCSIGEWRRVSSLRLRCTVLGQGEGVDAVRVAQRLAAFRVRLSITKR